MCTNFRNCFDAVGWQATTVVRRGFCCGHDIICRNWIMLRWTSSNSLLACKVLLVFRPLRHTKRSVCFFVAWSACSFAVLQKVCIFHPDSLKKLTAWFELSICAYLCVSRLRGSRQCHCWGRCCVCPITLRTFLYCSRLKWTLLFLRALK